MKKPFGRFPLLFTLGVATQTVYTGGSWQNSNLWLLL